MYKIIDSYIEKLMTSKPDMPLWNIEAIKQGKKPAWNYIDGCMMVSLLELYKTTKDEKYLSFVKNFVDYYVHEDGTILGYEKEKYSTDDVSETRVLFDLYAYTKEEKYLKAIELVHEQILTHPRTKEGNFWHKKIYPNQVWLDGLYMMQPFYTRYETQLNKMQNYSDIVQQFKNVYDIMRDPKTGLYYHGYDSSKTMFWADPKTGLSKNFWLRSLGWFTVALIDVYEYMDEQMFDERHTIMEMFKETVDSILKVQDPKSKMFYQVPNFLGREGNYLETSGSSMVAYAILKGVRLKALPPRYQNIGLEIFEGICNTYLTVKNDDLNLGGICLVAGLGPEKNLRRDGTYEYYMSEPIVENDAKGVGPFIMAYTEVKRINR
ncbi:MAG: glycoside hydrolase family 88 protein [Roseburia sp.]|nr:glycoside hydrolase family 88 protein [Anaeroplasma bactoclasticum]MCM1196079.1 glycoside hydrolase family 88 protein [Roseburia sp.]MCM1557866.1 glycoside hydrolase family 88 protein [Anaeroplasma bactoclasticum]